MRSVTSPVNKYDERPINHIGFIIIFVFEHLQSEFYEDMANISYKSCTRITKS